MQPTILRTTNDVRDFLWNQGVRDCLVRLDARKDRMTILCHAADMRWASRIKTQAYIGAKTEVVIKPLRWFNRKPYKIELQIMGDGMFSQIMDFLLSMFRTTRDRSRT